MVRKWLQSKVGKGIEKRWREIKESPDWLFVDSIERRFVNEKLAQGWEKWTDEDVSELTSLIWEIARRSMGV